MVTYTYYNILVNNKINITRRDRKVCMRYCQECGQKEENGQVSFCRNCGATFPQPKETNGNNRKVRSTKLPKTPLTKNQKRLLMIVPAVFILFITLYQVGAHFTSHERLINNFSSAIADGDAKALAKTLSFYQSDEKISETDVDGFLAYLEEEPDEAQAIMESLAMQSELIKGNGRDALPSDLEGLWEMFASTGNSDTVILEKGDGFLFYDTYQLAVKPVYATINTNLSGTTLFDGDQELATSDTDEFEMEVGPFVPGIHKLRAVNETDYTTLKREEEAYLMDSGETFSLDFDATYVMLEMPFKQDLKSRVIINDKETDFDVFSGEPFGPVPLDGSTNLTVEVDFPWGTMTSTHEALEEENILLTFDITDKLQEAYTDALKEHMDLYLSGWENNDLSKLDHINETLKGRYQEELEEDHENSSKIRDRQIVGMKMEKKNGVIRFHDDNFYLGATVIEEAESAKYDKDSSKRTITSTHNYKYEFVYKDGNWTVYNKVPYKNQKIDETVKLDIKSDLYTVKGSKKEGSPKNKVASEEVSETSNAENRNSEVEEVTLNYIHHLVDAINAGDYYLVQPHIKDGSPLNKSQIDLVERLFDKGLEQEVIKAEITDIDQKGDKWIVHTNETIKLIYESGQEETQDYQWKYTVEKDGTDVALSNIE